MYEQILMARQPIFDQNVKVVAYELLFRQFREDAACVIDGDNATSEVLVNAFSHLDINEVVGNKRAYINFTKNLLAKPPPFNKKRFVIEVLEDIPIDDDLVANLDHLSKNDYTIALDDFIHCDLSHRILPFADIVKLDVLQLSKQELTDHVRLLREYDVTLLAEKVETHEMYESCSELGFELFQGYFLCKPEIISGKKIPASKLLVLQLLSKLQDPDASMEQLEALISRDPMLSFKTLKLVNSSSYAPRHKIESLAAAITYLGLDLIRNLTSLLALSNLSDKPSALKDQSVIRAKTCELLGKKICKRDASIYFSVGLLSTLDAFFDQPLESLINGLSLHQYVIDALLTHEGKYGEVLAAVICLQKAEFDKIDWSALEKYDITPDTLNEAYQESIAWSHSAIV